MRDVFKEADQLCYIGRFSLSITIMEHKVENMRAYKVVEEFVASGRKLDPDDLFNEAYIKYQTGKHRCPSYIKGKLRQSISIISSRLS